jgi:predicted nucleic acid-binding protein
VVLVDTSIWIDHFRSSNALLCDLLESHLVFMHPFVLGELACGNLKNRSEIIALFHALPAAKKVHDDELLFFIEKNQLMGRGIGLIDSHLLASCQISACRLWTNDKRLKAMAEKLNIAFEKESL